MQSTLQRARPASEGTRVRARADPKMTAYGIKRGVAYGHMDWRILAAATPEHEWPGCRIKSRLGQETARARVDSQKTKR